MQSLNSQFYAFLVTILSGITIGILFDFYRVTRGLVRPRKIATYIGDLAFWVIATVVVFFMLLIGNWGEIRLYVWIGVVIGISLYLNRLSSYFVRAFAFIFYVLRKLLGLILRALAVVWHIMIYPFIIIRNIVIIPVGFIGMTCVRGIRWIRRTAGRLFIQPVQARYSKFKQRIKQVLIKMLTK